MAREPLCPSKDERVLLFGLLTDTNARLERAVGHDLEERCALPLPWFEVLLRLRQSDEGRLTMREVAEATVHSTGGTTRLIDRIEEAGFVARRLCPTDRRAIHVEITEAGNAKLDEALEIHLEGLTEVVGSRLSAQERSQLASLLVKLRGEN